jgi:hypothetical protein
MCLRKECFVETAPPLQTAVLRMDTQLPCPPAFRWVSRYAGQRRGKSKALARVLPLWTAKCTAKVRGLYAGSSRPLPGPHAFSVSRQRGQSHVPVTYAPLHRRRHIPPSTDNHFPPCQPPCRLSPTTRASRMASDRPPTTPRSSKPLPL